MPLPIHPMNESRSARGDWTIWKTSVPNLKGTFGTSRRHYQGGEPCFVCSGWYVRWNQPCRRTLRSSESRRTLHSSERKTFSVNELSLCLSKRESVIFGEGPSTLFLVPSLLYTVALSLKGIWTSFPWIPCPNSFLLYFFGLNSPPLRYLRPMYSNYLMIWIGWAYF